MDLRDFETHRLLRQAITNSHQGQFKRSVQTFARYRDTVLEDLEFQSLCDHDPYIIYIYELLECWTDSHSRPDDYPSLRPLDWIEVAESFFDDIVNDRGPSDQRWNEIYTPRCPRCATWTALRDRCFVCPLCDHEVVFGAG